VSSCARRACSRCLQGRGLAPHAWEAGQLMAVMQCRIAAGTLHGPGHFLLLLYLWSSHEPLRWCATAVQRACGLQVMKAPAGRRLRH